MAGRHELKQRHVVEVGGRGSVHGGVGDLDDEHLGEELDDLADGWRHWARQDDGWFAVLNAEILCAVT